MLQTFDLFFTSGRYFHSPPWELLSFLPESIVEIEILFPNIFRILCQISQIFHAKRFLKFSNFSNYTFPRNMFSKILRSLFNIITRNISFKILLFRLYGLFCPLQAVTLDEPTSDLAE